MTKGGGGITGGSKILFYPTSSPLLKKIMEKLKHCGRVLCPKRVGMLEGMLNLGKQLFDNVAKGVQTPRPPWLRHCPLETQPAKMFPSYRALSSLLKKIMGNHEILRWSVFSNTILLNAVSQKYDGKICGGRRL